MLLKKSLYIDIFPAHKKYACLQKIHQRLSRTELEQIQTQKHRPAGQRKLWAEGNKELINLNIFLEFQLFPCVSIPEY